MDVSFFSLNHAKMFVGENYFSVSYLPLNHPTAEKNINFHETCVVLVLY